MVVNKPVFIITKEGSSEAQTLTETDKAAMVKVIDEESKKNLSFVVLEDIPAGKCAELVEYLNSEGIKAKLHRA